MSATRRNLLHRSQLEDFIAFMGPRAETGRGPWELLKWKNKNGNKCAIFENLSSKEHLSSTWTAIPFIQDFHASKKVVADASV